MMGSQTLRTRSIPGVAPPGAPEMSVVLIVDDEPMIRQLLSLVLELNGFQVLEATSGAEAVRLFADQHHTIAVALLDVRMPGMGGADLMRALHQIDPNVPCCLMSGDMGEYTGSELLEAGAAHVFQKPMGM